MTDINNTVQTNLTPEEKWKQATIANNFIFYKVMSSNPDVFGKGLAKYTFENLCVENPQIKLNDRTYKYFFIADNYDKILDEKQKAFLKLVVSPDDSDIQTDNFTSKISKLVEDAKLNSQWRKQFMEWERQLAYKFREGLAEGKHEAAVENAKNLLKMNLGTPEQISQAVGLPLDEVLELQKQVMEVVEV